MLDSLKAIEGAVRIATWSQPFRVRKVLKFAKEIVHIALCKNTYSEVPPGVELSSLACATINNKDGLESGICL
jgi:hypothetical protein